MARKNSPHSFQWKDHVRALLSLNQGGICPHGHSVDAVLNQGHSLRSTMLEQWKVPYFPLPRMVHLFYRNAWDRNLTIRTILTSLLGCLHNKFCYKFWMKWFLDISFLFFIMMEISGSPGKISRIAGDWCWYLNQFWIQFWQTEFYHLSEVTLK